MNVAEAKTILKRIQRDPWWYVETFFGEKPLFPKQRAILESVRDYPETLVPSCHDSSKTFTAARAMWWFLHSHPEDSIVISTAPTFTQVVELLWREVKSAYGKKKVPFDCKLVQSKLDLGPKWYALGITSDEPVNYTGFHASNILVILDEADGIKKEIWDALEGVLTSGNAKLLAIGNPLDPTSEFARRTKNAQKPKSNVIRIEADDVLPVTDNGGAPFLLQRAWVENAASNWGVTSALYMGKVLAQWPDQNIDTLIPIGWLLRAKGRAVSRGIRTYGADIARFGSNKTVRTLMEGNWLCWQKATAQEDTFQTATRILNDLRMYEPANVQIDETGIGGGVVDQLRHQLPPRYPLIAVNNGGNASNTEHYANRGAEMWDIVRTGFEKDEYGFDMSDPDSVDKLIADLNRPTFEYDRKARMRVDKYGLPHGTSEYGLDVEKRAAVSPDYGDSFVLAANAVKPFVDAGRTKIIRSRSYLPKYVPGAIRI